MKMRNEEMFEVTPSSSPVSDLQALTGESQCFSDIPCFPYPLVGGCTSSSSRILYPRKLPATQHSVFLFSISIVMSEADQMIKDVE